MHIDICLVAQTVDQAINLYTVQQLQPLLHLHATKPLFACIRSMVYMGGLAALQNSCYGGGLALPPTAGVTGTGAGAAFGELRLKLCMRSSVKRHASQHTPAYSMLWQEMCRSLVGGLH